MLTAASMAPPPFGTAADVVSLGRSLWKGDWGGALLDVVGIIPLVGDGIKGVSKGTQIAAKMKQVDIAIKAAKVRLVRTKMGLSVVNCPMKGKHGTLTFSCLFLPVFVLCRATRNPTQRD